MNKITKIINVFRDRKGFDAIWDECDEEIRDEIREDINNIIKGR